MIRRVRSRYLLLVFTILILGVTLLPPGYSTNGTWRLLSPSELSSDIPPGVNSIRGVYGLNGNTGSINSNNAPGVWAVGDQGFIFDWDGFSWLPAASSSSKCELYSVNFGGPLVPSDGNFGSISSSSGMIVGGNGPGALFPCTHATALYYNGVGWSTYDTGLTADHLSSVFLSPVSTSIDAWAVGSDNGVNGAFWHWTGTSGSWGPLDAVVANANGPINSVYMTHFSTNPSTPTADDGWAVGDGGKVYHYTGGHWLVFETVNPSSCGTEPDLMGVAMDSTTDGWAVGTCGSLYWYHGGTWAGPYSAAGNTNDLYSITLLSNNEGWAVGKADATGTTIIHGTNLNSGPASWSKIPENHVPSAGDLFSVAFAISGNNIWAGGRGGLMTFCSSGCSDASFWGTTTSPLPAGFNGVYMTGANDGWVVGNATLGIPTIFHWDGTQFTRGIATAAARDLFGVWMTSSSDGWAVGGSGGATSTVHYTGGGWTDTSPLPCGGCTLLGINLKDSNNGWAVGTGGAIAHLVSTPSPHFELLTSGGETLYSVFIDPSNVLSVWAVGGDGGGSPALIRHSTDGVNFPSIGAGGAPLGTILRSIFMLDNNHIWVVGSGSTILFSGNNGATWSLQSIAQPVLEPLNLRGVFFDSNNDGWAVGSDPLGYPVLVWYNGASWTQWTYPYLFFNAAPLRAVALTSSTNGLAVGGQIVGDLTSLAYMLHLDPPGLYQGGTTQATQTTNPTTQPNNNNNPTTQTTAQTTTSGNSNTQTSSTTASSSTTSSNAATSEATTSASQIATSTQTSGGQTKTTTITTAKTTAMTSATTPLTIPAIPGFPWESILLGIIVGLGALGIARRRKRAANR